MLHIENPSRSSTRIVVVAGMRGKYDGVRDLGGNIFALGTVGMHPFWGIVLLFKEIYVLNLFTVVHLKCYFRRAGGTCRRRFKLRNFVGPKRFSRRGDRGMTLMGYV